MSVKLLLILALTTASTGLSACSGPPHPSRVHLVVDEPLLEMALGANAWHLAGLTGGLDDDPRLQPCDDLNPVGCELEVRVVLIEGLRFQQGSDGRAIAKADAGARLIQIDASVTGRRMIHLVAHEVAHVVFDCDHLDLRSDPSGVGIMSRAPTEPWIVEPTEADYSLACRSAGYCR